MKLFNLFTTIYSSLHPRKYIPNRVFSPLRYLIRLAADSCIYLNPEKSWSMNKDCRNGIIVSLTSFPARIINVWKVIWSLKNQEILPHKIILWLSSEQFSSKTILPKKLLELEDDVFEIRFVEGDLMSHKKYYYAMKEFPEYSIVTVDDDILYHKKTLSYLIESSDKFECSIVANLTKCIEYSDGELLPYIMWNNNTCFSEGEYVQIGAGGVLYPPHCLDPMVFDNHLFMKLAPRADDLWLNAMARLHHTKIVQTASNIMFMPVLQSSPTLNKSNVDEGKNDVQLTNIREHIKQERGLDIYKEKK